MSEAQDMVRACYEDGEATINGRTYKFHQMTHKKRRKVFAYSTHIAPMLKVQDFSFLDSPEFEAVEAVICDVVSINGSLLSRVYDTHWAEYPEDYITFMALALAVISYPFNPAAHTN